MTPMEHGEAEGVGMSADGRHRLGLLPQRTFAEARAAIGGLKGLLRALGDAPLHDQKWKNFPQCPFCGEKDCSGVFVKGGVEMFKYHHTGCSSGGRVMTEVEYLSARRGLSTTAPEGGGASPAYEGLLRVAGLWEEPKQPGELKKSGVKSKKQEVAEPTVLNPVLGGSPSSRFQVPSSETPNANAELDGPEVDSQAEAEARRQETEAGGKAEAAEGEPEPPVSQRVLQRFYEQLRLLDEDVEKLAHKRGLTPETIRRLGLVSSDKRERAKLEALRDEFADEDLLKSGLWLRRTGRRKRNSGPTRSSAVTVRWARSPRRSGRTGTTGGFGIGPTRCSFPTSTRRGGW